MNWLAIIGGFVLAVIAGAFLARLLERNRTEWSRRRKLWTAALVLPSFVGVATLAAVLWVILIGPGAGENMQHLAVAVLGMIGAVLAITTSIGGLIGASFSLPAEES